MRQTNIIWVAFVVLRNILQQNTKAKKRNENLFSLIVEFVLFFFKNLNSILRDFWLFLIIGISFVIFVVKHGGVAVGNNHFNIYIF
jgi:hypothetical protein